MVLYDYLLLGCLPIGYSLGDGYILRQFHIGIYSVRLCAQSWCSQWLDIWDTVSIRRTVQDARDDSWCRVLFARLELKGSLKAASLVICVVSDLWHKVCPGIQIDDKSWKYHPIYKQFTDSILRKLSTLKESQLKVVSLGRFLSALLSLDQFYKKLKFK